MKKKLLIVFLFCLVTTVMLPQARVILPDSSQITTNPDSLHLLPKNIPHDHEHEHQHDHEHEHEIDTVNLNLPAATVWRLNPRNGDRYILPMDTLRYNYQQTTLPDGYYVASGFLGPLGSPIFSKIFFDRQERGHFMFYDAYSPYNKDPETQLFFNTRVPYSQLNFQRAGSRQNKEERFQPLLTMNFNKQLNVGIQGDLINSLGFYDSQTVKRNDWLIFGNYIGEKIEAHVYASTSTVKQFENGGISNESFITEPESIGQSFTSNNIPVNITNTWNKVRTNHLFFSGKYNLGYRDLPPDSLKKGLGKFVPVASVIFTSRFTGQDRRFLSYDTAKVTVTNPDRAIDDFYPNHYYNTAVDDSITFSSFKNTLALSLREGFKPWVKFGLTGFVEHDLRNYSMIHVENVDGRVKYRESAVTIGGILNKQQGENLRFHFQADLGVLGANLGEFRAMGNMQATFRFLGKATSLSADAYIKNLKPKYFEENYQSKYFLWNNHFGDVRRVYVGGKLHIPFTNTTLSAGVENLQNYIYFDKSANIAQHGGNLQVLMFRADQKIRFGIFNWDNQVVYQTSGNQEVIPVPLLSIYSNMYLKALIVNELTLQLGIDAHFHTQYFVQGYEPALLQFYNQREKKIGNYPIATAYANMHLKQTRFFVMLYNVTSTFWKPREYFSLPNYPVNPFVLKLGVSVDLHN